MTCPYLQDTCLYILQFTRNELQQNLYLLWDPASIRDRSEIHRKPIYFLFFVWDQSKIHYGYTLRSRSYIRDRNQIQYGNHIRYPKEMRDRNKSYIRDRYQIHYSNYIRYIKQMHSVFRLALSANPSSPALCANTIAYAHA